ncbi:MAG: hypothetical protein SFY68_01270 [Candidatus Sumerlaeia bacterium]|nr:hypothetical protein [Candidatus Sumerlaeia bacterium]
MCLPDLTTKNIETYKSKLDQLRPETKGKWGTLDATRMLHHLRVVLEVALEERTLPPVKGFLPKLARFGLFRKIIFALPMPKNVKAPDELTPPTVGSFEEEKAKLLETMNRFASEADANPQRKTSDPMFGPVALKERTHMQAIHITHHFKQFGLM